MTLEELDELVLLRSDLDQDDMVVAGLHVAVDGAQVPVRREGPQLMDSATVSGETCLLAAANPLVSGSSAITGQPATDQRK